MFGFVICCFSIRFFLDSEPRRKKVKFAECSEKCEDSFTSEKIRILVASFTEMMEGLSENGQLVFSKAVKALIAFETCSGCELENFVESQKNHVCEDGLVLLRRLSAHSSGLRSLLQRLYRLRNCLFWILQLDYLLSYGCLIDLVNHLNFWQLCGSGVKLPSDIKKMIKDWWNTYCEYAVDRKGFGSYAHMQTLPYWSSIRDFTAEVSEGPQYVCSVCERMVWTVRVFANFQEIGLAAPLEKCLQELANRLLGVSPVYLCFSKGRIRFSCYHSLKKQLLPLLAVENGFSVSPVPEEIKRLNYIEKMLITPVHPYMFITRLKPLQGSNNGYRARRGMGVCLALPLQANQGLLNRTMPNFDSVIVLIDGTDDKKKAIVRSLANQDYVLEALAWLKQNNKHYADIQIASADSPELKLRFDAMFECVNGSNGEFMILLVIKILFIVCCFQFYIYYDFFMV